MSNKALLFLFVLSSLGLSAQTIDKGYYMFPVRPGEANYLAGTMGELRSGHFHTGLDIKTSGITGLPVFASAEGYIQRIKVSTSGYGNALYLVHPNGSITVYAHLKEFQDEIAKFVRNQQYKQESFTVDLRPSKDQFSFKKGDIIALSGNSGSSSGPHLHFEIRDQNHKVLDPLKFGFKEIVDDIAPTLNKIAFTTMDKDSRVNGMFGRFEFDVIEHKEGYSLESAVTLFGNIGVEVNAYDKLNGARNKNGILVQSMMLDNELVFSQTIEKVEFNKQRNILSHVNYKSSKEGGRRFNKYYVDDGNFLDYYHTNDQNGIISIFDPLEHSLDIQLEDSYDNVVQYHLSLNDAGYSKNLMHKNMYFLHVRGYDVRRNTLEIMSNSNEENCFARIFMSGKEYLYAHSYKSDDKNFYLWDLKTGLPDSANVCGEMMRFNFKGMIPSNNETTYVNGNMVIDFPKHALFDTLYLRYQKLIDSVGNREYYNFGHPDVPLRQSAKITFKPELSYDTLKSFLYAVSGNEKLEFVGGKWKNGNITLKTKDLLNYTIASDTIAPQIERMKSAKTQLRLKITDKESGIKSYRGELNGKWLLMRFDAKSGLLTSDPEVSLKGLVNVTIEDNSNNISQMERSF